MLMNNEQTNIDETTVDVDEEKHSVEDTSEAVHEDVRRDRNTGIGRAGF